MKPAGTNAANSTKPLLQTLCSWDHIDGRRRIRAEADITPTTTAGAKKASPSAAEPWRMTLSIPTYKNGKTRIRASAPLVLGKKRERPDATPKRKIGVKINVAPSGPNPAEALIMAPMTKNMNAPAVRSLMYCKRVNLIEADRTFFFLDRLPRYPSLPRCEEAGCISRCGPIGRGCRS